MNVLPQKVHFSRRYSAKKNNVALYENRRSEVVRHSLAYLSVQKWLVGDVRLKVNFSLKANHPTQRLQSSIKSIRTPVN